MTMTLTTTISMMTLSRGDLPTVQALRKHLVLLHHCNVLSFRLREINFTPFYQTILNSFIHAILCSGVPFLIEIYEICRRRQSSTISTRSIQDKDKTGVPNADNRKRVIRHAGSRVHRLLPGKGHSGRKVGNRKRSMSGYDDFEMNMMLTM